METTTSEKDLNVNDLPFEALILNANERKPDESQDVLILSFVNSVIVSVQIWKYRCAELIQSMPRERSTN